MSKIISLRDGNSGSLVFQLENNLPEHVIPPLPVTCQFSLREYDWGYALEYIIASSIQFTCLRCMQNAMFDLKIENTIALALPNSDPGQLMADYEVIEINKSHIDIEQIICDEIHLSTPEKHPPEQCSTIKI